MTKRLKKNLPLVVQCPCCDFFTYREILSGEVCPVCFWENDGLDIERRLHSPSFEQLFAQSGPNDNRTLDEARRNFENIGACGPEWLKKVCSKEERSGFKHKPRRETVELMRIAATLVGTLEANNIPVFREDTTCPQCEWGDCDVRGSDAQGGVVYGFPFFPLKNALKLWSASPSAASPKFQKRVLQAANQSGYLVEIGSSRKEEGNWIGTHYRIEALEATNNRYRLHYEHTFNFIDVD